MRMFDIISKKKYNESLSKEEIDYVINEYTNGTIPDYQMAALLMAIYFNGMNYEETTNLTLAMAHSGDMMDLSEIGGINVDKHSTGGVGDKTTLILAPMVAACGGKVAKMSGRGLGNTGGTIDKLESIKGFRTKLSEEEFIDNIKEIGLALTGQTGNLAPADKKIYALRDVTAIVDSIPLIASSLMSKKIAAGAGAIVLDVKVGSGAFMKNMQDAEKLAEEMVKIGSLAGRNTIAVISDIHSNIYALDKVIDDIKSKNVDMVVCTGDLVGYGTRPNEVIHKMKEEKILTIMGYYDDAIGNLKIVCGCDYPDPKDAEKAGLSMHFTSQETTDENKKALLDAMDEFEKLGY